VIEQTAETIALALRGRHAGSQWPAPCPAHEDTDPSLLLDPSPPRRPNKIDAYLEKKGYFGLSLETTLFESGPETDPDESTPYPTPSQAPTPGEHRRGSGNRCGHDPRHPNFAPPNPKRPKVIQKAIDKLYEAYANLSGLLGLNYHPQGFKVRSERREACIKVLAVMVEHMDLVTMHVGFPTEHGFFNYKMEKLAERTGMGLRRVARAVRDLKNMDFLVISQIRERLQDGSYRSFAAIKTVSPTLFDALGLRVWLDKERAKARERLRKKEKAYEKDCARSGNGAQRVKQLLAATLPRMAPTSPARHADEQARKRTSKNWRTPVPVTDATTGARNLDPVSKYLAKLTPTAGALISQLAVDIKMKHPDWSRENIYEEAGRLLPDAYRSPQSVPA